MRKIKFETIKIGFREYKIIDNVKIPTKPAYVNPFSREIGIKKDLNDLDTLVSLIHEPLHVIFLAHGFDHEYHDEKLISTISDSIVDLLLNNDKLIELILECKKNKEG